MNVKEGEEVECTFASTSWYKVGQRYKVEKDVHNRLGVRGSDGFFDPFELVLSRFSPIGGPKHALGTRKKAPTAPTTA